MKKNKKFLALALGTVLSLSMLAGCGSRSSGCRRKHGSS